MFGNYLKDFLKDRFNIAIPDIAHIQIRGVIDDFGDPHLAGQIEFPLIDSPSYSHNFLDLKSKILPKDLCLPSDFVGPLHDIFSQIPKSQSVLIRLPELLEIPGNIDLFNELKFSGWTGKKYAEQESGDTDVLEGFQLPIEYDNCRHGSPKYSCAICIEEKLKRIKKTTIPKNIIASPGIFDFLLPFLQPPIEPLLDNPVLFPPDRRPYDYQVKGIRFLTNNKNVLLGDDMGLGKTIQAIVAMQLLIRQRKIRNALILCPLSVLGTWQREIKKWAPELFVLKVRGNRDYRRWYWKSTSTIYLTTYDTFRNDMENDFIKKSSFDLAVLDEVQKIKNLTTQTSKSVRKLTPNFRWGLSGTPLENKIDDVISIYGFLKPDLFRAKNLSISTYAVRKTIAPHFLRRRIQDVIKELPEKKVNDVWLDLSDEQQKSYTDALNEARSELSRSSATKIHVFAQISKLKQICNYDPHTKTSCKLDYLIDQLEGVISSGYKALIFSQFPGKTLTEIENDLHEYDPKIYHGGLSAKKRDDLVDNFQETDSPKILLVSVKAGGLGLTLTRANYVYHFDHWWNPAVARQAEARAWRIGQKETVFVNELYTNNTIEERIYNILLEKQQLFDEVIDGLSVEVELSAFTDEDLFGLFDLKPPAGLRKKRREEPKTLGIVDYRKQLDNLTPYEFEDIVAEYYRSRNFNTKVTSRSRDGGVDLIARRTSDIGVETLIVQCKHYPNGIVGPHIVRELIGTWQDNKEANRAILITSGKISQQTIKLAKKHRIDLVDGFYLASLLLKSGIQIPQGKQ